MATNAVISALDQLVDRLAAMPPSDAPFITLYLDARANERGRDEIEPFLSKELRARRRGLELGAASRAAYDSDVQRIGEWVRRELAASANAAAIFACSEAGVFEAIALEAPLAGHQLYIDRAPHLYPLMRLIDRYRRYAAVVVDTSLARIFVFGLNTTLAARAVEGVKTRATGGSGWSQMRYQRHVQNFHIQHAKEVAETLDRIVREEGLDTVVLAGDEVIVPLLRDQLSREVASRVIDILHLDIRTPEHEVLRATLDAFHRHDERTDGEKVRRAMDAYAAGGLGTVGVRDTWRALQMGQVDELLLSADPSTVRLDADDSRTDDEEVRRLNAEDLATRAQQTDATVTFIEDASLLREVGGVAALLRFRLQAPPTPAR